MIGFQGVKKDFRWVHELQNQREIEVFQEKQKKRSLTQQVLKIEQTAFVRTMLYLQIEALENEDSDWG